MWNYVIEHYSGFLNNIEPTDKQKQEVVTKAIAAGKRLHARYYNTEYDGQNTLLVGSYGKGTARRPGSDADIIFLLPAYELQRIGGVNGNGQSQLLQEFRTTLSDSLPSTPIKADGQVVQLEYSNVPAEIMPGWLRQDGGVIYCDTKNGGGFKICYPAAEIERIRFIDTVKAGRGTALIKMLKTWKEENNVPIKSFCLEILAYDFLMSWRTEHHLIPVFWYDWMVRDFFAYMLSMSNGCVVVPNPTNNFLTLSFPSYLSALGAYPNAEIITLGDAWVSRCKTAYKNTLEACTHETFDRASSAEDEWKKVFGSQFPRTQLTIASLLEGLILERQEPNPLAILSALGGQR